MRTQLPALTALRFVAAAAIVLHHSRGWFGIPEHFAQPLVLDQGVSFFFVLSGFILTYVYPDLAPGERGRFLWARFARVWPAHAATFLLVVLLLPPLPSSGNRWALALTNLSLVQAWIPWRDVFFSYNSLSWTISTEAFFYLCFPLLVRRWERTWWVKLPLALLLAYGAITLCSVAGLPPVERDGRPSVDAIVYIHPVARLFEFVVGMTAALVWRRTAGRLRVGRTAGTVLELAAVAVVALFLYRSSRWAGLANQVPWLGYPASIWLVHGGVSCPAFALLVVVMALERGQVSRLLAHPVPVRLGEISYALYLLHQILLRIYAYWQVKLSGIPNVLGYALFWIVLLTASHALWSLVERPARRWLVARWARE